MNTILEALRELNKLDLEESCSLNESYLDQALEILRNEGAMPLYYLGCKLQGKEPSESMSKEEKGEARLFAYDKIKSVWGGRVVFPQKEESENKGDKTWVDIREHYPIDMILPGGKVRDLDKEAKQKEAEEEKKRLEKIKRHEEALEKIFSDAEDLGDGGVITHSTVDGKRFGEPLDREYSGKDIDWMRKHYSSINAAILAEDENVFNRYFASVPHPYTIRKEGYGRSMRMTFLNGAEGCPFAEYLDGNHNLNDVALISYLVLEYPDAFRFGKNPLLDKKD